MLIYKLINEKLPTTLCFPFVDPTNSILIVRIITITIATYQLGAVMCVSTDYGRLVNHLRKNRDQQTLRKSKTNSHMGLTLQLIMVTGSNFLCWIPTNIIYLSSLFMSRYPTNLLIWTTIVGTPINSIVHPIVFIKSSIRKPISQ